VIRPFNANALPSLDAPCVRNCCLNEHNVCLGCGRLLSEILRWHEAPIDERERILINAKSRLELRPW